MELAIGCMKQTPDFLILDAMVLNNGIHYTSVPKADEKSVSVAAASILAKVTRTGLCRRWTEFIPNMALHSIRDISTKAHIE